MNFIVSTVNMINLIFIAAGIGICLLCFLQITSSRHLQKEVRLYFQIFFLLILIYVSTHLARQLMDGIAGGGVHVALNAVTLAEMLAAGFMANMMAMLVLTASKIEKSTKKLQLFLIILLFVHAIIMIAGQFGGFIFYFDESNVYHRAPLYLLSNLCPLIMLIICAYLLIRYGRNIARRVRSSFWVYIIAPVVAIAIQSFSYGVQFIIFATVGAAVYLFSVIIRNLNESYEQQKEQAARIGAELSMATDIQISQIPRLFPAFPNRKEFDLYASMTTAKEVGGDFYDFFLTDDDHIALIMADVSGKGVPAALFMMISRVLIKSHLQNNESLGEALSNVNNQLSEGNDADMFVTVWAAVLEISTGKGIAVNAGHEHPVLHRANGWYEYEVYKHFPSVAIIEGQKYTEHEFQLNPGDSLFIYTDGVAEATNADKELFGAERVLEALNRDPDALPEKVLSNVMDGINEFVAGAEQFDDITMMCIRYNGVSL